MMGWAAARGELGPGAWILGAILFVWQIPHFLSLAWLYREDYERGGFRMLPLIDPSGRATALMVVLYTLALLPVGLAASLAGLAGWVSAAGSLVLGLAFLAFALRLRASLTEASARRVFLASLLYLPLVLGLMVTDRGPAAGTAPRIEAAAPGPAAPARAVPDAKPAAIGWLAPTLDE
jgi:heme O synthase-like polyprenyltransferase